MALHAILACVFGIAAHGKRALAATRLELPRAQDLAVDAATSARTQTPILLFFDREDCPYCERALREYLVPMSREQPWQAQAIYRQVEVDRPLAVVDFDGTATTHGALAKRFSVTLTPTVLVVDARGNPLEAPLVGLSPDFYAAYLENAIAAASKRLRR